jgi:plasmid stabilization system protein ParE
VKISWSRRAAAQLLEAERPGTGSGLAESVFAAVEAAADLPRLFPRVPLEDERTRRALIRRYGYWVIFEIRDDDETILVLSVWNARRGSRPPL